MKDKRIKNSQKKSQQWREKRVHLLTFFVKKNKLKVSENVSIL